MKTVVVLLFALACVLGLAMGQGFGGGGIGQGDSGFGNPLLLVFLLGFLLMSLFGNNSSSTGTGSTTVIFGNFTSPDAGK